MAYIIPPALLRRASRHSRLIIFALVLLVFVTPYLALWKVTRGQHGRWYWNYAVASPPIFIYLSPTGIWGPIESPPKWIPEINSAPWMGTYDLPKLSAPLYEEGKLVSPVILKLHVFSTVQIKSFEKRPLTRKHSYLQYIPPQYRHLIEIKFVLGHAYKEDWAVDTEFKLLMEEEQKLYGDLIRLNLEHGENLREGKILDWIHAGGLGADGGRPEWYLFKVDDDTVLNLPVFLDSLLALDAKEPIYLGTSLNRWPLYHAHFTGMVTGFSHSLAQTLTAGIGNMSREDVQTWWDDDVLTGEIMFDLPSGPQCDESQKPLPAFCDPHAPPPWGYLANPPSPDPRTGLIRHDYLTRMGDGVIWFIKGDVAWHSWWYKLPEALEKEWEERIEGLMGPSSLVESIC